jgi:hypothetical protein
VLNPAAGWYRGDLHAHTTASDGDYPPSLVVGIGKAEGLDFVAITDHNTIGAFSEFGQTSDILVIPGMEITLDDGDLNVFGIQAWRDWMEIVCVGQPRVSLTGSSLTTTELMQRIALEGLLISMNHPCLQPWEWRDRATDLRYVHCLEIWNDPYWPDNVHANPQAVALWTAWLNAGHRVTAMGGSDYHYPPRPEEGKWGERLGLPSTYVYAKELSVNAIITGLRRRRAYVSLGPRVSFQARHAGRLYEIGDDLGQVGDAIEFTAVVSNSPVNARAQILQNGQVVAETLIRSGQGNLELGILPGSARSDWYRLDVWDEKGARLAITNPIFVGPSRVPLLHKYGDFIDSPGGQDASQFDKG